MRWRREKGKGDQEAAKGLHLERTLFWVGIRGMAFFEWGWTDCQRESQKPSQEANSSWRAGIGAAQASGWQKSHPWISSLLFCSHPDFMLYVCEHYLPSTVLLGTLGVLTFFISSRSFVFTALAMGDAENVHHAPR